jgi:hypothetical protein
MSGKLSADALDVQRYNDRVFRRSGGDADKNIDRPLGNLRIAAAIRIHNLLA